MRLAVMTIHGMGSQQPGFSVPLHNELRRLIGPEHVNVVWEEVFWADITETRQQQYLAAARRPRAGLHESQELVVGAWATPPPINGLSRPRASGVRAGRDRDLFEDPRAMASVVKKIYEQDLGTPGALVVLAHSLGTTSC
jgi:hypothetical protein